MRLGPVEAEQSGTELTPGTRPRRPGSVLVVLQLGSGVETLLVQHQRVGLELNVRVYTIQLLLEAVQRVSAPQQFRKTQLLLFIN